MAFRILVTDDIEVAELDTEDLDINTIVSLADIEDISSRNSPFNIISLKGTKRNHRVFGHFFDLSRTSDFTNSNKLYYNYNPLRPVTALIYENSNMIFKGSMILKDIRPDKYGEKIYDLAVTSTLIDVRTIIQSKTLSDLDFTDMKHRYTATNIINSWSASTEGWNESTSAYTSTPFAYGKKYVYPAIDYGRYYSGTSSVNEVYARNFKPAVYAREYFNRIFSSSNGLSGITYEIKGSDELNETFNHLIIPDSQEGNKQKYSGFVTTASKPLVQLFHVLADNAVEASRHRLVPIQTITQPPTSQVPTPYLTLYNPSFNEVLSVNKTFTSAARIGLSVNCTYQAMNATGQVTYNFKIVKRSAVNNNDALDGWTETGQKSITLGVGQTFSGDITVNAGVDTYNEGDQIAVMVSLDFTNDPSISFANSWYDVFFCNLSVPPTTSDLIELEAQPFLTNSDIITPVAPVNIKQSDFLKGIINQFNFFVYSTLDNPKHLIFQTYNDFYAFCQPQYLVSTALDWSSKIDYKNGIKIDSNLAIPKSYYFGYKEDTDYFNTLYKNSFAQVYGELQFDDPYGLMETKKLELVFSPTIVAAESGTDRIYPQLYKVESGLKKPMKTNIRIIYYNGLLPCSDWSINNLETSGMASNYLTYVSGLTMYPNVSNYFITGNTVINDLYFNQPRLIYFPAHSGFTSAPNSYQLYYANKVRDLTNENVIFLTGDALLTEVDMANLDLRIPIYIQTGEYNGAYFKLNKVEHDTSDVPSRISLQKIGL